MHYLVLILLFAAALVIFLHNDHDRSYDKKEKHVSLPPESSPAPKPAPKPAPAPSPAPTPDPEPSPRRALSWAYLDNLKYDERQQNETMETEVTGMRYYCSLADVGPVNGIVRPEPGNVHDRRAQVVIRADGKKLGYLPRYALDEYENFNVDNLECPFAGTVNVDKNGYMLAFILIALPVSHDFVKQELISYVGEQ